ncbi:MAG TPA: thioredoxin family protein [Moraxellaceae bacterium]|nr:thioredoxin family protein [Moraxellaceae bacterium]
MKTSLLLLAGALLPALPGLWLTLRPARSAVVAGSLLLLLATSVGYAGVRQWREAAASPAPMTAPSTGHFQTVTPDALPSILEAARGRPVLLEFYADWCPSCQTWKRDVFPRSDVKAALAPVVLLQVDATDMTPKVQALLDRYEIVGLPALLAFDREGREQKGLRVLGEMKATDFVHWVNERLLPST